MTRATQAPPTGRSALRTLRRQSPVQDGAFHTLSRSVLGPHPIQVALVGVGGTGSQMLSHLVTLHQALVALGFGGLNVTAFDPDTVSQANLVRQRFFPPDLGRNKAQVLITRVNLSCGVQWTSYPRAFSSRDASLNWGFVISCVDTRASRAKLHGYSRKGIGNWMYWLDLGNDHTTGQAILGTPCKGWRTLKRPLPCATDLHPELMDTRRKEDNVPSCSAMESLTRQDLFIGAMVATLGADLLWELLVHGKMRHHARYVSLRGNALAARSVHEDDDVLMKRPHHSRFASYHEQYLSQKQEQKRLAEQQAQLREQEKARRAQERQKKKQQAQGRKPRATTPSAAQQAA